MFDSRSLKKLWAIAFLLTLQGTIRSLAQTGPASGPAEHVLLVVWDGMRPDFVTPRLTPNLWKLRENGVFFARNHPVYISSTEVNGTALATGMYPQHSGIIANKMYFPELNLLEPMATEGVDTIRRRDLLTGGHYIGARTVAEFLHAAGMTTAVAGTKDVALLQDRAMRRGSDTLSSYKVLRNGHTLPSSLLAEIVKTNGKGFPSNATPNEARDTWTTKALTEMLWREEVPRFSVLWLSEPDATQHDTGVGSSESLAAIKSSDRELGRVIEALEKKVLREKTDIFVVSDHAFSTVEGGVDVCEQLKKAGLKAYRKFDDPEPGEVLVVGLGGSTMFYVVNHEQEVVGKLVGVLQKSSWAGVIFTKAGLPGTFKLEDAKVDCGTNAPDVVLSMKWSGETNRFGAPGLLTGDGLKKGNGSHSSLSAYDMHNTLVAAGPHFRKGYVDELPTGNMDVAPTVLWLLGQAAFEHLDGRVLREALKDTPETWRPKVETRTIRANLDEGVKWRQYLKISTCEGRVYFDEGNSVE